MLPIFNTGRGIHPRPVFLLSFILRHPIISFRLVLVDDRPKIRFLRCLSCSGRLLDRPKPAQIDQLSAHHDARLISIAATYYTRASGGIVRAHMPVYDMLDRVDLRPKPVPVHAGGDPLSGSLRRSASAVLPRFELRNISPACFSAVAHAKPPAPAVVVAHGHQMAKPLPRYILP